MPDLSLKNWIDLLESGGPVRLFAGRSEGGDSPDRVVRDQFRDAAGNCRPLDLAVLAWVTGVHAPESQNDPPPEIAWWQWLTCGHQVEPASLGLEGPLVPSRREAGIEVWHEAELAALHALSWHSRLFAGAALAARCDSAACWLLEEVQPDNATNRPWAIHCFIDMAGRGMRAGEAQMYAQTLLHNSMIPQGVPDQVSSMILSDAVRWLRGEKPAFMQAGEAP